MTGRKTVYVRLLDEGVGVWRPVEAARTETGFEILATDHDPDAETWEFVPGQVVHVESRSIGGQSVLAAVCLAAHRRRGAPVAAAAGPSAHSQRRAHDAGTPVSLCFDLLGYHRDTEELVFEVELPGVSEAFVRGLLGLPDDALLFLNFDVDDDALARLASATSLPPFPRGLVYQLEGRVPTEPQLDRPGDSPRSS